MNRLRCFRRWPVSRGARCSAGCRQRGQALVEFSLLASFMAILLVGVVDFSRVFFFDIVVAGAAAEGARSSASGLPDSSVTSVAQTSAPSWMASDLSVTISPSGSTRATLGTTPLWTTVTVSYTFTPLTALTSSFMGNSITLTRSSSHRMRTPCVVAGGNPCS